MEAYLKNFLAREHVPFLADFSFNEVIESLDIHEVDESVSNL